MKVKPVFPSWSFTVCVFVFMVIWRYMVHTYMKRVGTKSLVIIQIDWILQNRIIVSFFCWNLFLSALYSNRVIQLKVYVLFSFSTYSEPCNNACIHLLWFMVEKINTMFYSFYYACRVVIFHLREKSSSWFGRNFFLYFTNTPQLFALHECQPSASDHCSCTSEMQHVCVCVCCCYRW